MDVDKLQMDPEQARKLYEEYRNARAPKTANDYAICAIYKRIAAGKLVVRALASITAAGLNTEGYPKLAIARADMPRVNCSFSINEATFTGVTRARRSSYAKDRHFKVDMPGANWNTRSKGTAVPLVPVHLRPAKSAMKNFHILWEADWDQYPVDPYLLRRFGEDAWLVVAAWDLTPVERAVMSSKLNA